MPGSYSISDIFRYFFSGFLILILIGINDHEFIKNLSDGSEAYIFVIAFIIGTIFYTIVYRPLYGWDRNKRKNKLIADTYLNDIFTNPYYYKDIKNVSKEDVGNILDNYNVYSFLIRHFREKNANHMSYQNKLVSTIHLLYMNSIIFGAYFVVMTILFIRMNIEIYGLVVPMPFSASSIVNTDIFDPRTSSPRNK